MPFSRPIAHIIKRVHMPYLYHIASRILLSLKSGMKKITPPPPHVITLLSLLVSSVSTFSNPELPHQKPPSKPITVESNRKNLENQTNAFININININKNSAD